MRIEIEKGKIKIDISDLINNMSNEDKKKVLELFIFDEIIPAIEKQLKHETEIWSCDGDGFYDGAKIREYILKIQGIEPEYKEDLKKRISSLEHDVENYKKYYDWYFKLYHRGELFNTIKNNIGDVK